MKDIISCTIEEDQTAVRQQWLNTMRFNDKDDPATKMARLMLACVVKGAFKTQTSMHESSESTAPCDALFAIDYLSHASRVILDYEALSDENKKEFLSYFPAAGEQGVFSRSATHAVVRDRNEITELKGILLGLLGQMSTRIRAPYDFGVNIAMGGEGQVNGLGKVIRANGYSGHMYFHHNAEQHLLMLGLEQTAPVASLLELVYPAFEYAEDEQYGCDQFDQGHSLTGASDTFTAAGSLYFSDPVYQAKLLVEKGMAPPNKYGGMQVTLDDENWTQVKAFIENLNTADSDINLEALLKSKPQSAVPEKPRIKSFIALDFTTYLKRMLLLIEYEEVKNKLAPLHAQLNSSIIALQQGDINKLQDFKELLNAIYKIETLPESYIQGINRIGILFDKQLAIDEQLNQTHQELVETERLQSLSVEAEALAAQAERVLSFYTVFARAEDPFLSSQQNHLKELLLQFNKLCEKQRYGASVFLSTDFDRTAWADVEASASRASLIEEYTTCTEALKQALSELPILISEPFQEARVQKLEDEIKKLEEIFHEDQNEINNLKEKVTAELATRKALEERVKQQEVSTLQLQEMIKKQEETIRNQQQTLRQQKITHLLAPMHNYLKELEEKKQNLDNRNCVSAKEAIEILLKAIGNEMNLYINSDDEEGDAQQLLDTFKENCLKHIDTANEVLQEHRGWKKILGNLAVFILSLGLGYLLATGINYYKNKQFLFFQETDSSKKLAEVASAIDEITLPKLA